jgi:hypothetical protein
MNFMNFMNMVHCVRFYREFPKMSLVRGEWNKFIKFISPPVWERHVVRIPIERTFAESAKHVI